jgi:UDP-N-acetyl-2-amino-2-deoxyglucuronate dehydrogenase
MREIIDSGEFGRMLVLRINAGQPFTTYRPDYRQTYYASREQGGGCVLDFASHFIDLAQWYMGPIESISGYAKHLALEGVEVEDTVAVTFDFDSGSLGSLHVNQYQPLNENCIDICGQDSVVRIIEPGFKCAVWRKGADSWEAIEVEQDDYLGGLRRQAAAFLSAIDGGPSMRTSFRDAAHTLSLCLEVLKEA